LQKSEDIEEKVNDIANNQEKVNLNNLNNFNQNDHQEEK
jgi:hypothetical protein